MKHTKSFSLGTFFLASFILFSCVDESSSSLEKSSYFDLKGFIATHIQEIDSVEVIKDSEIQGEAKQATVIYSAKDWEDEFSLFKEADINKSSLVQSYETTSTDEMLSHKLLPNGRNKVKYITVTYSEGQVSSVSIKIADDNLFYSSTTLGEIYMNKFTNLIDRYVIETSQKIWFLDRNDMKIEGKIIPKP